MMKRHHQPLEVMGEMNITNLLDTAFILLITFMLVAPQLTHGIKLELPTVDAPTVEHRPEKTLLVSMQRRAEGEASEPIYLDGKRVTLAELHERVRQARQEDADVMVEIEGDRLCSWDTSLKVLDAVKRAGVDNINLATRPSQRDRRR